MTAILAVLVSKLRRSQSLRLAVGGAVCLVGGAAAFSVTQHLGFGLALYWAITTATTVGYGDVTPHNTAGRIVASVTMLTTIPLFASAFALFAGAVASTHLRRLLGVERAEMAEDEVVVLGMHPSVPVITAELVRIGRAVTVVTTAGRSSLPDDVRVFDADPTSEHGVGRAHPERAGQVLIAGADEAQVLVTAVLVHQLAPKTPTVAIASTPAVRRALAELGVGAAISADELLAHTVAKSLEAPHAGELLLRIIDSDGYALQEVPIPPEAVGRPLSEARAVVHGVVLGAVHAGAVAMGVLDDPMLEADDRLLLLRPDRRHAGV